MEEPGGLQSMGSLRVGHNWVTSLSLFTFMHWRRKWQPTPVFLPGESQGQGSLVAAVNGVTQSPTRLVGLSSSSSICISEVIDVSLGNLDYSCASFSLVFLIMYSAYKWNNHSDNIQSWCTPFPIWTQSVVPCPVLTIASWPAYWFLRRQVRWSGIPVSFRLFHSLLCST